MLITSSIYERQSVYFQHISDQWHDAWVGAYVGATSGGLSAGQWPGAHPTHGVAQLGAVPL